MATSEVFRALSDPTRREILVLLREGDKSAGEIADRFPLARSTLSGHFNVLKAADLVVTERRATTIVYSLNQSAFEEALGAVMALLHVGESKGELTVGQPKGEPGNQANGEPENGEPQEEMRVDAAPASAAPEEKR